MMSKDLRALLLNRRTVEDSRIVLSQRLNDCFASLQDPRVERTRLHQTGDILTIAILAVLWGNGCGKMKSRSQ